MEFEIPKGTSFYNAVKSSKEYLNKIDKGHIDITFNEIEVRVSFDSNPSDLAIIYDLKCQLRRLKN